MNSEYNEIKLFELIKKGKFSEKNCFEWEGPFDKDGYGITTYSPNKIKKTWKVHRLMFRLLKGEIPKNMLICHACDNPKCFNLNHLFLGSFKDNSIDREEKGRSRNQLGEKNTSSKFTEKDIFEIRKLSKEGHNQFHIAYLFNCSQSHISRILLNKQWKHI